MKRLSAIVCIIILLCGCTQAVTETTAPMDTAVPETTVPETTVRETIPVGFGAYECQYTDPRDLAWEEDVVYAAQIYLGDGVIKGHPYLVDKDYQMMTMDNRVYCENYYQPDLRTAFIDEIQSLILRIPELTDAEIVLGLNKALALLGDAHSLAAVPYEKLFPIDFEVLYEDGEPVLYTMMLPDAQQNLIYSRLVAINDFPVDRILEKLREYIPSENAYWEDHNLCGVYFSGAWIVRAEALRAIGVMEKDSDSADFELLTEDGRTVHLSLDALSLEQWSSRHMTSGHFLILETLMYQNYGVSNYWYEYLEEDDLFYLRFNQFDQEENNRFSDFCRAMRQEIAALGGVGKFVVDLRNNPGGNGFQGSLIDLLNEAEIGQVYVLIDGGSFSQAVNAAAQIRGKVENATLVGTPAGQPINFWGGVQFYNMRNSGTLFQIPGTWCLNMEDFQGDALMPDIPVYQTIEDYRNGIDTVLEAVKNFE